MAGRARRGGLVVAVVALLTGCGGTSEHVPETAPGPVVIDLVDRWGTGRWEHEVASVRPGDPGLHGHLISGWGRPENATGHGPSAWVVGTEAEVELVLLDTSSPAVRFRCSPYGHPGGPEQTVAFELNDVPLGAVRLDPGLRAYELPVPAEALRLGRNTLRLRFAWAASPADHVAGSRDRRQLAAAFEVVEVVGSVLATPVEAGQVSPGGIGGAVVPAGNARAFRLGIPVGASLDVALDPATSEQAWGEVWVTNHRIGPRRVARLGPGVGERLSRRVDLGELGGAAAELWLVARSTASGPALPVRWVRAVLSVPDGELDASSNVILVVVDTLRADHVGCYGSPGATPAMDALAAAGVRFANAYCQVPTTGPSHSSLFTSLPPTRHGVTGNAQQVPPELDTIAETLQLWYRHTAAFVSLGVLKGEWGFSQGFERYEGDFPVDWFKDAREVTDAVLGWTAQNPPEPFFLWVHYSDPHEPYAPPDLTYPRVVVRDGPVEVARFSADGHTVSIPITLGPGTTVLRLEPGVPAPSRRLEVFNLRLKKSEGCTVEPRDGWWRDPKERGPRRLSTALPASVTLVNPSDEPRQVEVRFYSRELLSTEDTRARYRDEVAFVDRELGRLVGDLGARGYLERSLVVLVSDHGESLGEHHHVGHISQLYEPLLRVPLLMSFPGRLPAGVVVEQRVTLLDVVPTVHDLLGLPAAAGARGRSLLPLVQGGNLVERPVVAATFRPEAHSDLRSLLLGGHKLITRLDRKGATELYDLATDPGELVNLAGREPATLERLLALLEGEEADAEPPPASSAPSGVALSEEEAAQMRALGYIR